MAGMTTAFVPASTLRVAPAARNHVEVQGSVEKLDLDCQWWHWFSNKTMSDMSDMCFLLFVHVHFAFSEVFFAMICNKSHGPGQYYSYPLDGLNTGCPARLPTMAPQETMNFGPWLLRPCYWQHLVPPGGSDHIRPQIGAQLGMILRVKTWEWLQYLYIYICI